MQKTVFLHVWTLLVAALLVFGCANDRYNNNTVFQNDMPVHMAKYGFVNMVGLEPARVGGIATQHAYPVVPEVAQAIRLMGQSASSGWDLASDSGGFTPLFNGRDFSGWKVVVQHQGVVEKQSIFQVRDGMIHVYPEAENGSWQPFAGLITERSYRDYHLRFQFRWGERKFQPRAETVRDAGVLIHLHGDLIIWPPSVECQIQEGDCGDLWVLGNTRASAPIHHLSNAFDLNGDLRTVGAGQTGGIRVPRGASWETPGWNTVELIVRGADASFFINGKKVNEARHMRWLKRGGSDWDWQPLEEGAIFLQAEGAELFYRQIEIRPL